MYISQVIPTGVYIPGYTHGGMVGYTQGGMVGYTQGGVYLPVLSLFWEIIPCSEPLLGDYSLFWAHIGVYLPVLGSYWGISPCSELNMGDYSLF